MASITDVLKAGQEPCSRPALAPRSKRSNKLLKMHRNMADVMKIIGGGKAKGPMAGLAQMLGMGGGMPSPEEMAKLAQNMPGGGLRIRERRTARRTSPICARACPAAAPAFPDFRGWENSGLGGGGGGKLPTPGGLPPDFSEEITLNPNTDTTITTRKDYRCPSSSA